MKPPDEKKGLWIPDFLMEQSELNYTEKAILSLIVSLDNDEKGCYARNGAIAEMLFLPEKTVANILTSLRKRDFVYQCYSSGHIRGLRLSRNREQIYSRNQECTFPKSGINVPEIGNHI